VRRVGLWRRLKADWPLALFSLLLAFSLWVYVASQETAYQRRTLSVPLRVVDLPPGMLCVERTEKVTVTLAGPRGEVSKLMGGKLEAQVSALGLPPGRHLLRVKVSLPPGLKLVSLSPRRARVVLERVMRKEMVVRVAFVGLPPEGERVAGMEVRPPLVRVEGPASKVSRARMAVVLLEAPFGSSKVEVRAPVRVLDEWGLPLFGLSVSPPTAMVALSLKPAFASKTLPIHPQISGSPAEGFEVASVEASPNFVTVSGDPGALRGLDFIRTAPVDISGASGNIVRRARLLKPPGVEALSLDYVSVVVRVRRKPSPPKERLPEKATQPEESYPPSPKPEQQEEKTPPPNP